MPASIFQCARALLNEAGDIERMAQTLAAGVESEVAIAVDTVFPNQLSC